jgi:hypothetical protein
MAPYRSPFTISCALKGGKIAHYRVYRTSDPDPPGMLGGCWDDIAVAVEDGRRKVKRQGGSRRGRMGPRS